MLVKVSIGECLDKFSILEIKRELISDPNRITEVEREIAEVQPVVALYLDSEPMKKQYGLLKRVNRAIWDQMDALRDGRDKLSEKEFLTLCKDCIDTNDVRFRIKNRINRQSDSELKEQKSYRPTSIAIDSSVSVDTRELLFCLYDEVSVEDGGTAEDAIISTHPIIRTLGA